MVNVISDFTVHDGETYATTNGAPVLVMPGVLDDSNYRMTILNLGTIRATFNESVAAVYYTSDFNGFLSTLDNRGLIESISTERFAYAVFTEAFGARYILNSGTIHASGNWDAYGIVHFGGPTVHNQTDGLITVTSNILSIGVYLANGGEVINDGTISVSGDGAIVRGIWIYNFSIAAGFPVWGEPSEHQGGFVQNDGEIVAATNSDDVDVFSYGISVAGGEDHPLRVTAPNIVNHGTITADYAIYSYSDYSPSRYSIDWVVNTGTLNGKVSLDLGNDILENTGVINGDVFLGWGDDVLDSRGGTIAGQIDGGDGDDTIWGGDGDDWIYGGWGVDTIYSSGGNDFIFWPLGDALVDGGEGVDTLSYGGLVQFIVVDLLAGTAEREGGWTQISGIENVEGGTLNDWIAGDDAANVLNGGGAHEGLADEYGADRVEGRGGNDQLFGEDGDDILDGGTGADAMTGGAGDDTFVVDHVGDTVIEDSGQGTDTVQSSISYALGFNVENLTLTGGANLIARGNALNNVITGNDGDNTLVGDAGADRLDGSGGVDGVDYSTSTGGVRVNLGSGQGLDYDAQGDRYLSIENAIGSAFDDRFTGSSGDNEFRGGQGVDTLLGQNGNDRLFGDAGNDILNGGNNDDILIGGNGADQLLGGTGVDTADYSASAGPIRVNLASLQGLDNDAQGDRYNSIEIVVGSNFADRFTGSANGDTFRGGAGADVLLGQNGDDVLDGGSGADNLNGGNNNDVLIGGAGADVLAGGTGIDIIDYSASAGGVRANISANLGLDNDAQGDTFNSIEGVIGSAFNDRFTGATQFGDNFRGGDGDDTLLGQAGNDLLFGEAGNDTLTGGGNDDLLNGGLGADSMNGGAGLDAFVFADALGAGNIDTITGFSVADDVIHLSTAIFGVGAGALSASAFVIGAAAADTDDRIIYNSTTGALLYDADGNGAGAAVQFAALGTGLALTNADFFGFDP